MRATKYELTAKNMLEIEEHSLYEALYTVQLDRELHPGLPDRELYLGPPDCDSCHLFGQADLLSPLVIIKKNKKMSDIIYGRWIYRCALKQRIEAVQAIEIDSADEKLVLMHVLLDLLQGCPGEKNPELRKALILYNALIKYGVLIKALFGCDRPIPLAEIFYIPRATVSRLKKMLKTDNEKKIERLVRGDLEKRGMHKKRSNEKKSGKKIEAAVEKNAVKKHKKVSKNNPNQESIFGDNK